MKKKGYVFVRLIIDEGIQQTFINELACKRAIKRGEFSLDDLTPVMKNAQKLTQGKSLQLKSHSKCTIEIVCNKNDTTSETYEGEHEIRITDEQITIR